MQKIVYDKYIVESESMTDEELEIILKAYNQEFDNQFSAYEFEKFADEYGYKLKVFKPQILNLNVL